MIVSGWHDGHGSYGLRIVEAKVSLWFRPEWKSVTVHLPDQTEPVSVPLSASFWQGSPELRSSRIKAFFNRNGLIPWEKQSPPHFQFTPEGDGVFRLEWIVRPRGQSSLPLE